MSISTTLKVLEEVYVGVWGWGVKSKSIDDVTGKRREDKLCELRL
jgi:hypothetical protein